MKKLFKILAILLCLTFVQTPVTESMTAVETVQAAAKSGLKKEGGQYYYYVKGKKVKNTWKTVKVSGKSYKYYFGSNGKAYKGGSQWGEGYLSVKKISGKWYGFDKNGRMVTGTYVSNSGDKNSNKGFYVFSKKGVLDNTKSKKIRAAAKSGKSYSSLKKLIGSPKKRTKTEGCSGYDAEYVLTYTNFYVNTYKKNGKEYVLEAISK